MCEGIARVKGGTDLAEIGEGPWLFEGIPGTTLSLRYESHVLVVPKEWL